MYRDADGIIRVGGGVDKALVSYETKRPCLLPKEHWVSRLIVATTAAKTRTKYWIVGAHDIAKLVKFICVFCREMSAKAQSLVMADLPPCCLAPFTLPFHYTSCEYFGPPQVKIGRNKAAKHYGVLFTCLNTRAVNLELAVDCSTMEFIQVLRRFFALRGVLALMISDNGSQFVGA
ncbi:uncharacterized protein [Montipora capricornis]|uniref:uncharacterized protein n=1 Tax=Montipora capricornis TaxID=246305 RepID=UPI0035F12B48